ncbi:MAG: winged helix DNA-binding domain-containing protein [Candidatus Nanopelagicales bacterium]
MDVTAGDVVAARLANLRLSVPGGSAAEVADWCGALQAQDLSSGKWSLGVRMPGATEADVDEALATGAVLRTWPMRGTIHIVHPANAHWMLDLTGRRALLGLQARWDYLGLDQATVERAADVLGVALAGKRMTRAQCLATLDGAGVDVAGQRSYHLLWYAAQTGVTCIGPNEGSEQTFVLLDDWAKDPRTPTRDEALALLARMYFQSHGPASRADFQRWTGLTATDAKKAVAGADLATLRLDGQELLTVIGETPDPPRMLLLPGFDEFMLGYKDRSLFMAPEHLRRVVPGGNGMFKATVVERGRVIGTWQRKLMAKSVRLTVSGFAPLKPAQRADVTAPAERYAAYLGRPLDLRFE